MTPEERFQKQIDFILSQQAQFYADLQKLDERLNRNAEQIQRHSEQIRQNTDQIRENAEHVRQNSNRNLLFQGKSQWS